MTDVVNTSHDMRDRICVVTGANAGIGKATALGLAKAGATVVLVCRDQGRGEAALAEILRKSGSSSVSVMLADLSSRASIRRFADEFRARHPGLHVLINNAASTPRSRTLTEDNLETQFAVNHLSQFLLTNLLLDLLKASAPARIVNVSSKAHNGRSIDFDDLQSERSYSAIRVYGQTKLANILFTYELARRVSGTGVTANCLHPGLVATKLLMDLSGLPRPLRWMTRIVGISPERGSRTPLFLATSPEVEGVTGRYFIKNRAVSSSVASYDAEAARRLWKMSTELTGL